KRRKRLWIILGILGGILLFSCVVCSVAGALTPSSKTAVVPTATPTQASIVQVSQATPSDTPTPSPTPSPTPTPRPTATPTPRPTPTPTQAAVVKPTPTPIPPTPTPVKCQGVNGNPWCYDFNPGNLISYPPSGFCNYFNCIASFYGSDDPGDGYITECADGTFSQSGGERGACSSHGGELKPLYSH